MSATGTRYLICYDITDDKRRIQLSHCLDSYGGRVQHSVYEAVLSRALFDRLIENILEIVRDDDDKVTVYPLCAACEKKAVHIGQSGLRPGEQIVYIV